MRQIPERPLAQFDLSTPEGRKRARRDYMWNDHIGHAADAFVDAFRGFDGSFYVLEKEACEQLGLKLVDFTITSREVPSRARVLGARDLFQSIEYPALMHCKSGADRAGIMSVFYMHFRKGKPIAEALDQLHLRYLHMKAGKTGVLDYVFERYLAEGEPAGLSFVEWVESPAYQPDAMKADFRAKWWGNFFTERLLKRE
ncbi:MAG: protein tyrosine phosphatase [Caulobacterales bacterium 32-67-6]|nr:MAG: protein tyrosine phosphatase [Caulobacterales bacterium 32-67-6]